MSDQSRNESTGPTKQGSVRSLQPGKLNNIKKRFEDEGRFLFFSDLSGNIVKIKSICVYHTP